MTLHSLLVVHEGVTYLVRLSFKVQDGYLTASVVSIRQVSFFDNRNLN